MAEPIILTTKHDLGIVAVKQRITERFETLKQTVKIEKIGDTKMYWEGDTAHFSVKALGQRATATVAVTDDRATVTLHLPMILAPFKGAIVAFISKQEDTVKGKDVAGQAETGPKGASAPKTVREQ